MSAPDRIWHLIDRRGKITGCPDAHVEPCAEVAGDYVAYVCATSEADELRAECDILRTEKHADAEAIGALRQALREISCVVSWEISLSNYTHQEVCDINRDFIEIGDKADAALAKRRL